MGSEMCIRDRGMGVGILFYHLARNWRYLADTIKAALNMPTSIVSKGESSLYRLAYLMLILTTIGWIALFMASGASFPASALFVWAMFAHTFLFARCRSLAGYAVARDPSYGNEIPIWFSVLWGPEPGKRTAEQLFVLTMAQWQLNQSDQSFSNAQGPAVNSWDAIKVGRLAGLSDWTVLKVIFVASLIGIIVTVPVQTLAWHHFGLIPIPFTKNRDTVAPKVSNSAQSLVRRKTYFIGSPYSRMNFRASS